MAAQRNAPRWRRRFRAVPTQPAGLCVPEASPIIGRMFGLGIGELLVVLVIILVVFGAGRLPEVMGSLGKGVQAFKKGLREPPEIDVTPEDPEAAKIKKS
jgi:sec-independent protein translocase protein TatA